MRNPVTRGWRHWPETGITLWLLLLAHCPPTCLQDSPNISQSQSQSPQPFFLQDHGESSTTQFSPAALGHGQYPPSAPAGALSLGTSGSQEEEEEEEKSPNLTAGPSVSEKNATPFPSSGQETLSQTPAAETFSQTPAAETFNQSPAAETFSQTPAAETFSQTPAAETLNQTPAAETLNQTPAAEMLSQTPAAETLNHTPAAETLNQTPAAETLNQTPAAETFNQTPAAETLNQTPAAETLNQTPAAETLNQTPAAHIQRSSFFSARALNTGTAGNTTTSSSLRGNVSQRAKSMAPPEEEDNGLHNCPQVSRVLSTMPTDAIEWRFQFQSCQPPVVHTWTVQLPESYGLVVEFDYLRLKRQDNLMVHTHGQQPRVERVFMFVEEIQVPRRQASQAPLFVYGPEMTIYMTLFDTQAYEEETTAFRISYTAYLNESLPTSVPVMGDQGFLESSVLYNCTGLARIPEAIMCDGISHCEHGEDESGCSYQREGCGGWFPYGNYCLKALFSLSQSDSPQQGAATAPVKAEQKCRSDYRAWLADLPDERGLQIAAGMIRASGFLNAVVGIKKVKLGNRGLKHLYKYTWHWVNSGSQVDYRHPYLQRTGTSLDCAVLFVQTQQPFLKPLKCVLPVPSPQGFVCMRTNPTRVLPSHRKQGVTLSAPRSTSTPDFFPTKECSDGSRVHLFQRCLWREEDALASGGRWSPDNIPLFPCVYGTSIHYTLVCDGHEDCIDGSDEMDCHQIKYPPLLNTSFQCNTFQIVPISETCDGTPDCFDDSDEGFCSTCSSGFVKCPLHGCLPVSHAPFIRSCSNVGAALGLSEAQLALSSPQSSPGNVVRFDGLGMTELLAGDCPEDYFQCHSGLCLPSFLVNNRKRDCPDGDDEDIPMQNVTCPGYYRCEDMGICLDKSYLCDGIDHCPNKDDERFCHLTCPRDRGCRCEGLAFTCSKMIDPLQHLHLRYLDISHASDVSLDNIHVMEYLVFFNMSFCFAGNITLADMPQLQILDLRFNALTQIVSLHLYKLPRLKYLDLSDNPFLETLNNVFTTWLAMGEFHHLQTLILSNVGLDTIGENVFSPFSKLEHLDIRHNPVYDFAKDSLQGLPSLKKLYTDESKLCCQYFHSTLSQCLAPEDELSTCNDLLGQDFFRLFLWMFSLIAILGNMGVLIYRQSKDMRTTPSAHSHFVKNLCISDFLMGVYMVIIGIADSLFRGDYVAKEKDWMSSLVCQIAGFLSFVSSEVSAFVICVITLERVLVICFPFKAHLHIGFVTSRLVCGLIWLLSITLAVVPFMTGMEFYGQNGICVPLPITRKQFTGQNYAFGIFIIMNFVIFLLIALGQVLIYRAIQQARRAARSQHRGKDLTLARRLFLIVLTDFCCWFPIGVMGLLAYSGVPIPGRVNVWAAIFIMPVNSALNPFLYTLNELINQWKKRRMDKRITRILYKLEMEIPKWDPANVNKLAKICVQSKVVQKQSMMKWMGFSIEERLPSSSVDEGVVTELEVSENRSSSLF